MKRLRIQLISLMLVFLLLVAGCNSNIITGGSITSSTPYPDNQTILAPVPVAPLADIETALERIYQQVNPSVVNISVLQKQATFPNLPEIPGFPLPGPQYSEALGSGFVWDNAGHIVTNNHVIVNADNISVTFHDGTVVSGFIVGSDSDSDLAILKVDLPSDQIKPVQIADSSQLKVGQLAIAIGNPFGLQGTMTVGFISGLGRVLPTNENAAGPSYSIPDIIQTDAAINPGNSGGVLLDDTGRVIGVTYSIVSTSGTSGGVGFAIPSAIVQQVVPSLISTGSYRHPYLGLSLLSLEPEIARSMNLPANQRGALIETVTSGSPADKAGLRAGQDTLSINGRDIQIGGDVIIGYNGQVVKSSDDLVTFLARSGYVGETITLTILRSGQQMQVPVILGVRPSS